LLKPATKQQMQNNETTRENIHPPKSRKRRIKETGMWQDSQWF